MKIKTKILLLLTKKEKTMRKITLLIALVAISIFTFGQSLKTNVVVGPNYAYAKATGKAKINTNQAKSLGEEIWSYDFAEGIPSTWVVADATGNNFTWTYSTVGPRGFYTADTWNVSDPTMIINSPTASNGFMMLESDWYNSTATGATSPVVAMDSYFVTEAIDCSNNASVVLSFSEYYRYCCTNTNKLSVFVSTNGTSWTEFTAKQDGIAVNAMSTNGYRKEINISSAAANQATVYIRFHQQGASHYFWMIDDISLNESLENDIILTNNYVHFNESYGGWNSIVPLTQAQNMGIFFGSTIESFGAAPQNNVTLNAKVMFGGAEVYSESSQVTEHPDLGSNPRVPVTDVDPNFTNDYVAGDRDTFLLETPAFTPTAVGEYTVIHSMTQDETDENPSNNKDTMTFKVEENTYYAMDNGTPTGWMGPQMWVDAGDDGDMFGVNYNAFAPDTVFGLAFYCASTTEVGPSVTAHLFWYDGSAWTDKLQSDLYDITEANLGQWVYIPFLGGPIDRAIDAFDATTIGSYMAVLEVNYGGGKKFRVGEENKSLNFNRSTSWKLSGETDWAYFINYEQTPMIRLLMGAQNTLGINNNNISANNSLINVYPNPTSGIVKISNANNANISVYNMLGEVVMTANNVNQLDMSSLSDGNYMIKVQTQKELVTKKINLTK